MNRIAKLLKYNASAGSGKTHALTSFYLSMILHDPGAFRRILAVTFTNAAAAEMKERILERLYLLGQEEEGVMEREKFSEYLVEHYPVMWHEKRETAEIIKKNAPLALLNILQHYSRFSVGTIDSFFQRIIRSFAREMEIPSGYEIELEHEMLLSEAVDSLLSEVAGDEKLLAWVSLYVSKRLDDNRSWDIRREVMEVAREIFGEEFRQLDNEQKSEIGNYKIISDHTSRVSAIREHFESKLKRLAEEGVKIYSECGLTPDDFLYKRRGGVGESLVRYSRGEIKKPNSYWEKAVNEEIYFTGKMATDTEQAFNEAFSRGLRERVKAISLLFDKEYPLYLSARAQEKTIHVIGILGAISDRVRQLAHDQNLFLLSDSGELISRLIADDDTPFIYEKIGTTYDHFVIDEFQDTSRIQWNNFRPLIAESLSRGYDNLVVGDVKQSIYRWRNSDWQILHQEAEETYGSETVSNISLSKNYRSRINIIKFNNALFSPQSIPALCDEIIMCDKLKIKEIYNDAQQTGRDDNPGGYVKVALYGKVNEKSWQERVLQDLPSVVEELQDHGYRADQILFLCRTNTEGKSIINRIIEYSAGCPAEKLERYNYEVTSGESLLLERSPAVTLLTASLKYLTEPVSPLTRSRMIRSYILATGADEELLYSGDMPGSGMETLPQEWEEILNSCRNDSLYGATRKMIALYGLGSQPANIAYLSSFQDVVLTWSARYSSDISAFVRWWENEGHKSTVSQSDRQDAMRVMTIHKAKGLQSKVVIIPFLSWEFSSKGFNKRFLWVTDVPQQFAPMPVVLPVMSKSLEESLFSEKYKMERASEMLDGVNLLYVAMTRAVDALYIMSQEIPESSKVSAGAAPLFNKALLSLPDDFIRGEKESCLTLELGVLPPVSAEKREPGIEIEKWDNGLPDASYRLRTGSALPAGEMELADEGGRSYGIMMHELLSRIVTTDDIEEVIDHACRSGLVSVNRRSQIAARVREMTSADQVKEWFDGTSQVLTEASVILPGGTTRRPDRVMLREGAVTVVDYKFGEPKPFHRRQAEEYRSLMLQMGYTNVKSWLWYVEKKMVEEV